MKLLIVTVLVLLIMQLEAQEKYDVFIYKKPVGYTQKNEQGFVSFTKLNEKNGSYCVISLYGANKKNNSIQEAFDSEWADLVVKPFGVKDVPTKETAADIDGWQVLVGLANFDFNEGKSAAMLYCLYKNNTTADVLVATNSSDYESDIEKLMGSVHLNSAAENNNQPTTSAYDQKNKPTSIIGDWSNNDMLIANYVTGSGAYVGDATIASNKSYKFNSNGTYEQLYAFTQNTKTHVFYTKGKYSISTDVISLSPTSIVYKLNTVVQPTTTNDLKAKKLKFKFDYNTDRNKWYLQVEGIGNDYTGRDVLYSVGGANNNNKPAVNPTTTTPSSNSKFGGGITGIWLCYTNNYPISVNMIWKRRVFFNDGTFLQGHPYYGLINFKEDENNELGTYKINGNNGSINMKKWSSPTAMQLIKPNQLKIGTDVYYKSDDVNGKTFSGSYTSYDFSLFSEVAQQPVNNRSLIHFYSNGTFVDEGIFKIFLTSYDESNDSPGKGTYSIKDYTITFKYDDGRIRTSAISTAFSSKLQDCKFLSLNNGVINKYK
jgi:hypothetical protein